MYPINRISYVMIHEFNHSFINHYLDENKYPDFVKELEPAATDLFISSRWSMAKQAYGNWKTVINESLVRAAVICYMLDKEYKPEEIKNELLEQVQRNFRWMPELVSLLKKYEKKQSRYENFENFYPKIIDFFMDYAKNESERLIFLNKEYTLLVIEGYCYFCYMIYSYSFLNSDLSISSLCSIFTAFRTIHILIRNPNKIIVIIAVIVTTIVFFISSEYFIHV